MATAPRGRDHLRVVPGPEHRPSGRKPTNRVLLWFGVLGGPSAFLVSRVAGAVLVSGRCLHPAGGGSLLGLSPPQQIVAAITIVCALIAAAAGIVSWRIWIQTRRSAEEQSMGTMRAPPFWALGGLFVSSLFFIFIVLGGGLALGLSTSCAS